MPKSESAQDELTQQRDARVVQIYRDLWPQVEGFSRAITPPEFRDDVMEIARFYFVCSLLQTNRKPDELRALAFTVAKNARNDYLRKKSRRSLTYFDPKVLEDAIDASDCLDATAEDESYRLKLLSRVLGKLTQKCRYLLFQHYGKEQTYKHMARWMEGNTWGAVAKATARCLKSARAIAKRMKKAA